MGVVTCSERASNDWLRVAIASAATGMFAAFLTYVVLTMPSEKPEPGIVRFWSNTIGALDGYVLISIGAALVAFFTRGSKALNFATRAYFSAAGPCAVVETFGLISAFAIRWTGPRETFCIVVGLIMPLIIVATALSTAKALKGVMRQTVHAGT